jgi:hypothetical protein
VRLAKTTWGNHSRHVALYLTTRGLTTSTIPDRTRQFQIDFDFIDHQVRVCASDGARRGFPLTPMSVAGFFRGLTHFLAEMAIPVGIHDVPNEIPDPISFSQDRGHAAYDYDHANRYWRELLQADRVFERFRARFTGKCRPVHFFWGATTLR